MLRMNNIWKSFVWLSLAFVASNCQIIPFGAYHHNIDLPGITGELHTSTINSQQPIRQMSAGFNLNPPPPLQFLQPFTLNSPFFSAARNFRRGEHPSNGLLQSPVANLFTPNQIRQKPQSDAQDEAYRTYLKEEAEELEKEREQNDITTAFEDFGFESTSSEPYPPSTKTFVRVNIQGKDYSYAS